MGLDGGTYITRADVLRYDAARLWHTRNPSCTRLAEQDSECRGQSWAMANSDSSRSTRGGTISASTVYQPKGLDKKADRYEPQLPLVTQADLQPVL